MKNKIVFYSMLVIILTTLTSCFDNKKYEKENEEFWSKLEREKEASIVVDTILNINGLIDGKFESTTHINKRSFYSKSTESNERYLEFFYKDYANVIRYEKIMLSDIDIVIFDTIIKPTYKHSDRFEIRPTLYINSEHINTEVDEDFNINLK